MATFPAYPHKWSSEAKPVESVGIDVAESGATHAYLLSGQCWYDVTLINVVHHDLEGVAEATVSQFYQDNKLSELVMVDCKGYRYIGLMKKPPQAEQLQGFGRWEITTEFRARRVAKL